MAYKEQAADGHTEGSLSWFAKDGHPKQTADSGDIDGSTHVDQRGRLHTATDL